LQHIAAAMPSPNRPIWLLISSVFACCLVAFTFSPVLRADLHAIPSLGSDAGKNIFTLVYHSLYGKGMHFTGMNYPYGEQIIYTDGLPLLSVPLGYLGCKSAGTALSVMWVSLLLSYVLAIVFTFRVLLQFGVRPLFSVIFSGLIVLMSAQLLRTTYHFGLSYACLVPMLFFWTIRYQDTGRWKYALWVLSLGLIVNFLHPYLSAVVLVWVMLYCAGYFLLAKLKLTDRIKHILPLIFSALLMLATVGLWIKATDKVKDRPITPYGLTVYCTTGENIFTSYYSPIWRALDDDKGSIQKHSADEGATYLGIVVIAILVMIVIRTAMRWNARRKGHNPGENIYTFPSIYLFMAIAALVLAMGVPFVWGMEGLVNYISVAKQFRTMGRFAWIMYYIISVYGAVTLCRWFDNSLKIKRKELAYGVMTLSVAIWGYEANGYISTLHDNMRDNRMSYELLSNKKHDCWPEFLAGHRYQPTDFQAILLLPFFNVGTEKLWIGEDASTGDIGEGTVAGIQLHLPWINAMMARSSWSMAQRQVKISGGKFAEKPMLNDLPNDKPFLLMHGTAYSLNDDEAYLLRSSDFIGNFRSYDVYACYPGRILKNDHNAQDSLGRILAAMPAGDYDTCIGPGTAYYINHFDTSKASQWLWGGAGAPQIRQLETEFLTIPLPGAASQIYEFSCWFFLSNKNYRSPFFKLDLLNKNGETIGSCDVLTKKSTDNEGLWFRASAFFTVSPDCTAIRCRLRNEPEESYISMDELQLRPLGAIIISRSKNNSRIMVNNHLMTL
jgi:hypothetical protein